jgi:DNA processing protein
MARPKSGPSFGRGALTLDSTFDLLTLALLPGTRSRTARDVVARTSLAEALARPGEHPDHFTERARQALLSGAARRAAEAEMASCAREGVALVGWDEPSYPPLLRRVYDPPPVLWVRGQLHAGEGAQAVAVVGARQSSPAGQAFARVLARDLAEGGVTVVSGLARGIDTSAHEGALLGKGRTVAVLGSGLGALYPPENAGLAARIAEAGAVVSEFPFSYGPQPRNFPRRNRVIAGWGAGVVVVEASERSGALGTARCALDEGREVLAVPGHPASEVSAGTNALIRDGAVLVRSAADVAEALGLVKVAAADPEQDPPLLRALRPGEPLTVDELSSRSGTPTPLLLRQLTELEMLDKVRRLPGALYVRN